ncbi:mitoferrin-1-like [Ischnura elegans]|uniref:mitoferrin-1-like n=1 Tax=Ischnura elegans TaxID=197161 RepID=UPI001ED879AF|nr:mitoferrin-1-like [Ischnura elegans]
MNFEDYESLPTNNVTTHMTAGAIAGIMEHCVMYPLDSVKTRMQSLSPSPNATYRGVWEGLYRMVSQEGLLRPCRGMCAVVTGAGPAHALYFSTYEYLKEFFTTRLSLHAQVAYGISGCVSTLLHDAIMNPAEVVKQRLQMYGSPFKSCVECATGIYQKEGMKAFYRSYTTQLTMNVPFQSVHFMTYEFMQGLTNESRTYSPMAHVSSGAVAGATAAALTTPLDVCKTLLNTQEERVLTTAQQDRVTGLMQAARTVYRLGGIRGYFQGLQARVIYQVPSTAICWSTYEFFKYSLRKKSVIPEGESLPPNVSLQVLPSSGSRWESEKSPDRPSTDQQPGRSSSSSIVSGGVSSGGSGPGGLYGALAFNSVGEGKVALMEAPMSHR